MNLNIFGRVIENLIQYLHSVVNLPVPCQYFSLRDLPDYERVIKGGGFKIERACRANDIRRVGFD